MTNCVPHLGRVVHDPFPHCAISFKVPVETGNGPELVATTPNNQLMRTPNPIARMCALFLPMSLVALLAVQCSSPGAGTNSDGSYGDQDKTTMDANTLQRSPMAAPNTPVRDGDAKASLMTAAEERRTAMTDMRGSRASLVADLEEVRDRLNVGTNPYPQREADQKRAAELAQGLERVDRALVAMEASTDSTWASIRESQMKEVQDVREWMKTYKSDNVSANK